LSGRYRTRTLKGAAGRRAGCWIFFEHLAFRWDEHGGQVYAFTVPLPD
jgi:hypothetical protein